MAKPARRRRRWIWLGLLPALAIVALLAVRWLLEPERLSAFLLRQASQATGLQLALSEPAGVGFWPDLHLELSGLEARAPGADAAILRVQRVDAVLPWSAVISDEFSLRSLRLSAPELDWAPLQTWLATRESTDAPARLPRVDAAIEVIDGRVDGEGWSVETIALALPSLRTGERLQLQLDAKVVTSAHELPLDLTLELMPRDVADGLRFDDLSLELHGIDAAPIVLRGSAQLLRDDASIALAGSLPQWPADWPALPLPPSGAPLQASLAWVDSRLTLALARGEDRVEARLASGDITAWLHDPDAPLLPPLQGEASATRLQFGALELQGVELRIDEDAADAEP